MLLGWSLSVLFILRTMAVVMTVLKENIRVCSRMANTFMVSRGVTQYAVAAPVLVPPGYISGLDHIKGIQC